MLNALTSKNRRTRKRFSLERLEDRCYLSAAPLATPDAATQAQVDNAYGQLPLSFEANQGQADALVNFLSRGDGYSLFLSPTQAVLNLQAATADGQPAAGTALSMQLIGGNPQAHAAGLDQLPGVSNYLIGDDPSQWHTNVPNYARVDYQNVYPGVDLVYYGNNQRHLEYDFVLAANAKPSAIQLSFQGAQALTLDSQGNLELKTSGGDVIEQAPVVYQDANGGRQVVSGKYVLEGHGQVGFQIGAYDHAKPLVIDPTYSLAYSTYLGGSGGSLGNAIAVDNAGNAYVTGNVMGGLPLPHPLQGKMGGGGDDAFVTKLNASGTALIYSTYLGGNGTEIANGIAVDAGGNAYVTGETFSTNFPTKNALQPNAGGGGDVFLAKLNATGSALLYSTYLGGNGADIGHAIALDGSGDAFLAGYTASASFPTTTSAFQSSYTGGTAGSPFVIKLNTTLSGIASRVYSTYLGSSGQAYGIAVDGAGSAYVTGLATIPTTPGAFHQSTGNSGAFVSKLNATGTGLAYSTIFGGLGSAYAIAVDASGDAYVTGQGSVPTTSTAFQLSPTKKTTSDFMTEINSTGSGLIYSSYLGGDGTATSYGDRGQGIALDGQGHVYITGYAYSSTFPTVNAFQPTPTLSSGQSGAFVAEFDTSQSGAASLIYSSYLGGSDDIARGNGIAVDSSGNVYVTGMAYDHFPTTAGAFQSAYPGPRKHPFAEAFVTKIEPLAIAAAPATSSSLNLAAVSQPPSPALADALFAAVGRADAGHQPPLEQLVAINVALESSITSGLSVSEPSPPVAAAKDTPPGVKRRLG